jgi:hypothetical protein
MSRKSKATLVRTEMLAPQSIPQSVEAQLAAIIERKVADILASQRGGVLEPFFQPADVSTAIRKQQTVPQQRKWTYYFAEWGCLRCDTKERSHVSHGMCGRCSQRVFQRLATIIRTHTKNETMPARMDAVGLAQTALAPSLKLLHGETVTVKKTARRMR